ncbi:MAG: hypothetical protein HQK65_12955 [Desulfamplus sp.]|nr:hypothetical protein [Desulfamplus sp.]
MNYLKKIAVKYTKSVSVAFGFVVGAIDLAANIFTVSLWINTFISLLLATVLGLVIYLYIEKSKQCQSFEKRTTNLIKIFEQTHNTWHSYKQLSDELSINDVNEVYKSLSYKITTIINDFHTSLELFHPGEKLSISVKYIKYDVSGKDNRELNAKNYKDQKFTIFDMPYKRDTHQGPIRRDDVISGLTFDPKNKKVDAENLRQTLFYQSFISKQIKYVEKFNETQQLYTKKYSSGLVAPINWFDIPFGLLCIGSKNIAVFSDNDHELIATFVDAIAEFIRMEQVLKTMIENNTIVITDNKVFNKIREALEHNSELKIE